MKAFYLPTNIVMGEGCFAALGKHTARYGQRAMLVCGARSLRAAGHLDRALDLFRAAGVDVMLYAVSGEPTLDVVQEGLDRARAQQVEVLIGIGGGSAMDAAKAIAGLYAHPGRVEEYFDGQRQVTGGGLPWIAVPTTAGTGAEVTMNAVLISTRRNFKTSLRHDAWFARVALIDPELTLHLPPDITAASGSDALTQAIEAYTSIGAMPVTDAFATDAILRIGRSLERAFRNGQDPDARADLLYGSMLAGCAFSNARLGGVHGMAHPLGARYHMPHGLVCGLLLPYMMAYNVDYALDKFTRIAELLGVDTRGLTQRAAAEQAVERVRALVTSVEIPMHLSPFGVRQEDLGLIIQESLTSSSLKHNPRPLTAQDVETVLVSAL